MTIEAAGGVVWRPADNGVEVLLVHRPAHGDWTLPKGKPHPPEEPHETALREVWEETGLHCRITSPAGMIHYITGGEDKLVRYWAMRPTDGSFVSNQEVDEVRWLPSGEAVECSPTATTQSWWHPSTRTAGSEAHGSTWSGTPMPAIRASGRVTTGFARLSRKGWRQTAAITELLRFVGIERIISSPYLRCTQTVEPLAEQLGLKVEEHPALAEGSDFDQSEALLDEVARTTAVLCSHGDIIPALLDRLNRRGVELIGDDAKKGSIWVLEAEDGEFKTGTYQPPLA